MSGPYPVPPRFRWSVIITFPDGDQIAGTDDADIVARWARRAAWVQPDGEPLSARELKRSVARRALRMDEVERHFAERHGRPIPDIQPTLPWDGSDAEFLDAGAARGYWELARK